MAKDMPCGREKLITYKLTEKQGADTEDGSAGYRGPHLGIREMQDCSAKTPVAKV